MSNAAGIVIVAIGVLIAIVGIRGTQATVIPPLFASSSNSSATTSATSTANTSTSTQGTIV
jgi:hypothetical protein